MRYAGRRTLYVDSPSHREGRCVNRSDHSSVSVATVRRWPPQREVSRASQNVQSVHVTCVGQSTGWRVC
eukprot:989483-Pleurochrysis_carterae.AAC.1